MSFKREMNETLETLVTTLQDQIERIHKSDDFISSKCVSYYEGEMAGYCQSKVLATML